MQKIVTIGGGTGHYQVLRGLKYRNCELTALVNVCDNGGHSGQLRDEYGVLPPGDLRQCLIALADDANVSTLRQLFEFRMPEVNGRAGINLGNMLLAGLEKITGNPGTAMYEAGKILGIRGRVIPMTEDSFHIMAELEDGTVLNGQYQVSYPESRVRLKKIMAQPVPHIHKDAADALKRADKIVIGPGDLYGSIISNFLVKDVKEAIEDSQATLIYVCNLVTKEGTQNFKAKDFIDEIEKYLGTPLDHIIINNAVPSEKTLESYSEENSALVKDNLNTDQRVRRTNLLEEYISPGDQDIRTILRHDPRKTSREIIDISSRKK